MWRAEFEQCGWTSGDRITKEAAKIMAEMHEDDNPGHEVKIEHLEIGSG